MLARLTSERDKWPFLRYSYVFEVYSFVTIWYWLSVVYVPEVSVEYNANRKSKYPKPFLAVSVPLQCFAATIREHGNGGSSVGIGDGGGGARGLDTVIGSDSAIAGGFDIGSLTPELTPLDKGTVSTRTQ